VLYYKPFSSDKALVCNNWDHTVFLPLTHNEP